MSQAHCYHCGLPVPEGVDFTVNIEAQLQPVCCLGCQAVAQAIVANGLLDYYRHREALPESPRDAKTIVPEALKHFDHVQFQESFVRALGAHEREAALIIEGITCAACIWLNEQHLAQLPGVTGVEINFATRRARVRWDEQQLKFSEILAAIAAIGYRAHPYDISKHEALAHKERRQALWRLFVAGFGMMQVMMYAVPAYLAGEGDLTPDIALLLRWASLVLTTPVVLYSAGPFFRGAWRDLKQRRVGMDVPVALGVGAAFVASVWATLTASGEVYFDSVTMFVFFLLGGRYLEMRARQQAVSVTEALAKLMPAFAERVADYPTCQQLEQVLAVALVAGDVVRVKAGEIVPADGVVLAGDSYTNESLLSGESSPVAKFPGASVIGGAINTDSPLLIKVEQVGESTRLAAIIRLMERAAMEKPQIVALADRVASRFIAALLLVAVLVALCWLWIDPTKALWITVSVLVVTCPCALSLATPIALTVASGALARQGVLVARSYAVERLAQATHFVFDKTGTLTMGEMRVLEVLPFGVFDQNACLALAAKIEQASEHPIGAAICAAARERSVQTAQAAQSGECFLLTGVNNTAGRGMSAECQGEALRLGRPDFVAALHGQALPAEAAVLLAGGDTVVALGNASGWLAFFRLGDSLRPDAKALVDALRADGRQLVLLSGDAEAAVHKVARALGIDTVRAAASPQEKHDYVKRLQEQGALVAMVGDGVNDAPVLAQAQVSVAMGSGSQLASTQADLILLSEHLLSLQQGVALSRRSLRIIRQNLLWSFAYNFLALPLAMFGFVTPWMAGLGMSGSSLLVVLNSLRLQKK